MKKIFALLLAAAMTFGLTACSSSQTTAATTAETTVEATTGDISNPSVIIRLGDVEPMSEFVKSVENGEMDGVAVMIEGVAEKFGSDYSIMEKDEESGESYGVTYVVADFEDGDYPEDGEKIWITGIVTVDGYARVINVPDSAKNYGVLND